MSSKIIQDVSLASQYLTNGDLVAFPTETVYGLGADASNQAAIQKVFTAKGRPQTHPLIVHIASQQQLSDWAINIPASAYVLANAFWPGPLTMLLTKHPQVSPLVTGGQDTIALRAPNHSLTLNLLREFGSGIVGPSANIYGHISPTTAEHVAADLGDAVAAILDGGPCSVGIESTIVHLDGDAVRIMRQGNITVDQLSTALGFPVSINKSENHEIKVSGSHLAHYAPHTPLHILSIEQINSLINKFTTQNKTLAIISFEQAPKDLPTDMYWLQVNADPDQFAHDLYAMLRDLDQKQFAAILIEQPPQTMEWGAINDRLTRASAKYQI